MHRLGSAFVLVVAVSACEPSKPSTPPEPTSVDSTTEPAAQPEPEAEPEPAVEPEAEPEPEPEAEPEVSEIDEAVFSKDGFEARDLHCSLAEPTRNAARYIAAGLADQDAALDACAPEGAAVEVNWVYLGGPTGDISVVAETSSLANCVTQAMSKVRAGVEADCRAVILIGDPAGATAAYEGLS